ncbi:MAG: hypothetical protein ACI9F9_002462 [Candidatus Paceibacteria bacterium]|jgi:hypothetical protein
MEGALLNQIAFCTNASQGCHAVKGPHRSLQALVGRARGCAEGLAALLVPIPTSPPPLHFGEAVQGDVALVALAVEIALLVWARRSPFGSLLQLRLAVVAGV